MKKLLSFLIFFCALAPVFGQQTVTGKVTDELGSLPGVNILIKGTSTGTVTDIDGNYTLTANPSDSLLFSYLGYVTQTVAVGNRTVINIVLKQEKQKLNEVVVVGYGTMRKSDVTGATATVAVDDVVAKQYSTVDQLLQGRAAGVQVTSNQGNPGSGVSVRIRGTNSLRGNNEPLYVVDGIIITTAGEDANSKTDANDYSEAQNGLAGINPKDIESIEILKDASATAIYGSRGANGVVLITTKKGKKGEAKINAYYSATFSQMNKKLDVLSGAEYAQYQNEIAILKGELPRYYIDGDLVYPMGGGVVGDTAFQITNWQDEAYRLGISHTGGISFSGGSDKGSYYVSLGASAIQGVTDNSNLANGNMRVNLTRNLTKKLKFDSQISLYYSDGKYPQGGSLLGANGSFVKSTVTFNPLIGADVEDFQVDLGLSNPDAWINDYEEVSKEFKTFVAMALTYDLPVKGLKFQLKAAGNNRIKDRRRFYGLTTFPGSNANGQLSMSSHEKWSWNINSLLMYNRYFNKIHRVNATLGYVFDGNFMEDKSYTVENFVTTEFMTDGPEYGQLVTKMLTTSPRTELMNSFLTRFNYGYKEKYIATVTFRADGSSKFAEGQRYGYFPSFSLAWRMMEENFIKNMDLFSNLKLRAGWGQTGNQAIQPYQTMRTYKVGGYSNYDNSIGKTFVPNNIANPDLTWETTNQTNVGLDMGFFNNRLTATIDAYYKDTYNLLQLQALPTSTGFVSMYVNQGSISNKGIDIMIDGTLISKKDMTLSIGGNISFNKNKVIDMGIPDAPVIIDGEVEYRSYYLGDKISKGNTFKCPANIFMVDEPVGMFWGFKTDGIWQKDNDTYGTKAGDVKMVDLNNDGKIDEMDRTFIGDPNPEFTFGFNGSFTYKRFSASMNWSGVYGNDIANGFALEYYIATAKALNVNPATYHDAWRPNRPENTYPRIGYSEEGALAINDRIIEDGSYLRLDNLTLGYDIPLEKIFDTFHFYVSGRNLLTFTKYSSYDPNVTSFMSNGNIQGVDWNPFPNARILIVGLNINF
jgi:TonB-linked SusC/RagA family outer membrane protein